MLEMVASLVVSLEAKMAVVASLEAVQAEAKTEATYVQACHSRAPLAVPRWYGIGGGRRVGV